MDKFSGATNNINQIAKKTHQNNSISNEDLETIIQNQKEMQKILVRIFKGVAMLWRQSQSKKHKI
ncbi:TPA: plasmid mobilization relaxosome protein MobC [Staphylococcus aureus]|nr:plasmid mobilization relaxosome protein MobC [Staphylococcus aureus]